MKRDLHKTKTLIANKLLFIWFIFDTKKTLILRIYIKFKSMRKIICVIKEKRIKSVSQSE
jgi:hypothetical protein